MGDRIRTIQRNRYPLDPCLLDPLSHSLRHQCPVRGQRNAQSQRIPILRQLENVWTIQWLTTAQYEDRVRKLRDLFDDVQRFRRRQLGRRDQLGRRRTAVDAAQVAAFGDFPEDQAWLELFTRLLVSAPVSL